jgi:hypothetical protein
MMTWETVIALSKVLTPKRNRAMRILVKQKLKQEMTKVMKKIIVCNVMIHNSKRRETCDYVYYYLGFTAAGNDSAGNRQRSGLYIGGNNEGRSLVVMDQERERKHRKEGVLEGRKVSWSSSTRQSQDVRDVVEVVC